MKLTKYAKSLRKLYRKLRCSWHGGERILVLGDSHSGVFEYIFDHDLWPPNFINCDLVGGATACGLLNDHSQTRAFLRFQQALRRFPDYTSIVVMLGEVDCSFALWHHAEKAGNTVFDQIDRSLRGLERLLKVIQEHAAHRNIVLAGAILPTIKDHQIDLQTFELRKRIRASQIERTELILRYNEAVRHLATNYCVGYIDITRQTLNPYTGVVDDAFLVENIIDHHQSQEKTAHLWIAALSAEVARLKTGKSP